MDTYKKGYIIFIRFILHKLVTTPEKETALLAIPEICADKIISLYHANLSVGNQGVIETYLTIGDRFFIPGVIHHLRSYIKGCHICQLSGNEKSSSKTITTKN